MYLKLKQLTALMYNRLYSDQQDPEMTSKITTTEKEG